MSKYTPGPWEVCPSNNEIINTDHGRLPFAIRAGYTLIGALYENEANARLIAAAPDLLLELDNCLDLLVTCFPDSPDNSRIGVAVTKARAAIAKATGETK